jgi:hypothetical protein
MRGAKRVESRVRERRRARDVPLSSVRSVCNYRPSASINARYVSAMNSHCERDP